MRIKLHENAASNYVCRCYRGANPQSGMLHRPEWEKMLKNIEGLWLEVETEHLFRDQFNTAPIPGVSENGMRIMIGDVSEIEDDIRADVIKCRWCYGYDDGTGKCGECGKTDYLEPLNPISPVAR